MRLITTVKLRLIRTYSMPNFYQSKLDKVLSAVSVRNKPQMFYLFPVII